MVGTIKRLVKDRGFGFIRTDEGDVFFHRSVVRGKFEELQANQKVRIEVVKRDEGMAATTVEQVYRIFSARSGTRFVRCVLGDTRERRPGLVSGTKRNFPAAVLYTSRVYC